ncbi:MAG TPA: A24 family peptidase, partial [Bacillota bacterium]|nr:A24 family peptidase [Bacillota bacterium]
SLLIIITFIDLDHMIIPDEIVITGIIIAFIVQITGIPSIGLLDAIIGLLVGGGSFLTIALLSKLILKKDGIGGGDIKLMAMIGALLGWKLTVLTIFLSAYIAGILGGGMLILKIKKKGEYLPYGPFIAIAAVVSIYWGMDILNWWLGL